MAAIITTPFRVNNARNLIAATDLFITVGKSDQWPSSDASVESPEDTRKGIETAMRNIVALKKITSGDVSLVIPRVNYSNSAFKEWDPTDETCFIGGTVDSVSCLPCYCVNGLNVYKCVSNNKNSSGAITAASIAPTHTGTAGEVVLQADGYSWAYMYSISSVSRFNLRDFIEVPSTVGTPTVSAGKIYGYRVKDRGDNYASVSALSVVGDGTGAAFTVTISGNKIVKAQVDGVNYGSNYTVARVTFTGVSSGGTIVPAVIEPLVAPLNGHGYDPAIELGAYYATFAADLVGAAFSVANDYRQIGLIKAPLDQDSDPLSVDGSGYASGLKSFTRDSTTEPIAADDIVYNAGAKAFVDYTSGANVYYHQNDSALVNYGTFTLAPVSHYAIDGSAPGAAAGNISAVIDSDYKHGTGELLFLENRSKISRDALNTEEIRIIIQF